MTTTPPGVRPLRRNRDYLLLWSGSAVSVLGSTASTVAYPLLVLAATRSPADAGLAGFVALLPMLLCQIPAGALVDRWNRRKIMIVCDAVRAVGLTSIVTAILIGQLHLVHILLVGFVEGIMSVTYELAAGAAVPTVVHESQVAAALSGNEARERGATMLGTPLGGILFGIGRAVPFVLDALTYLVSLVTVLFVRREFQAEPVSEDRHFLDGIRWLWRNDFLRTATFLVAGSNLLFRAMFLIVVVMAGDRGASPAWIGGLFGLAGGAGLLGSLAASWCQRRLDLATIVIGANWVWAALMVAIVSTHSLVVLGIAYAGMWFVGPLWNVAVTSYQLTITPGHLQGRVLGAVSMVAFGALPLGSLVGGYSLSWLGPDKAALLLTGWMVLLAAAATLSRSVRRTRRTTDVRPDAQPEDAAMTTLPELFRAQVARTPSAGAVRCAGVEVSYAELDRRANQLAHRLIEDGVGPESVVGVSLPRSVELVVALLGVHKAGAAYLPLDPDYPAARIDYIRADSGARTVITAATFAALTGPEHDPEIAVDPAHPAYVIYTSGSTGRPKGVVIDHRGIVNRLRWMQQEYRLDTTDRVLQKTPYSFDVSVWEFFWPLITGATLVLARPGGHRDPAYLAEVIAAERITTIHFVPSMLRAFLAEPLEPLPTLRRLLCSGEALPADLVAGVERRIGCPVHNLYGPTEASVDVTAGQCRAGEPVTIGRPIANTEIQLVDDALHAADEGELCIAGVQLARGYLGRPALTAERFVPNPFGDGDRLYRTGDLARWRDDGSIEYLGRIDHQVKIRGHRIELGEIESVLHEHPAVRAAVVSVHQSGAQEARLVAYLVPAGPVDGATLRAHLLAVLPEAMVPALFLTLPELPLSPSGKIDRGALPAPDGARPALGVDYQPPRSAAETALVEIWEQVLEIGPIGVGDPFVELGGQSLAAARICARVRQRFGGHLSAGDLLDAATIERMATLLAQAPAGPPPILRIGS